MAWYLKITCYKVTVKNSQFSARFRLLHKLQPALIASVSIYVVLSISTMGFTTIYEFLESLIENTHTCSLWRTQKSFFKAWPAGVATAPLLKPGLPNREHILSRWLQRGASPGSFCSFLFGLAPFSQSLSVSLSPPVDKYTFGALTWYRLCTPKKP